MTSGPWQLSIKTRRGAPVAEWKGIAASFEAVQAETSLMREIAWTAMLGPGAPPLPKILAEQDYVPGADHPDPPPGWICNTLDWEVGSGFSRQLEKIDYGTFAPALGKAEMAELCEAVLRSDPYVAELLATGTAVSPYIEDRTQKVPALPLAKHPYCARIRVEIRIFAPKVVDGKLQKERCHPATLTALMAIAMAHQNHPERNFFEYYYCGTIAAPASATLRAIMDRGERERTEAAYARLEGLGFAKLVAALRTRTT